MEEYLKRQGEKSQAIRNALHLGMLGKGKWIALLTLN